MKYEQTINKSRRTDYAGFVGTKWSFPKPAYNTVSTIIRILETKEFVGHTSVGRGFIYHPIIAKESYSNESLQKLMNGYFEGSFNSMVSFFVKKNKLDISELETILKEINKKKSND